MIEQQGQKIKNFFLLQGKGTESWTPYKTGFPEKREPVFCGY